MPNYCREPFCIKNPIWRYSIRKDLFQILVKGLSIIFIFGAAACATSIPAGMENQVISQSDYEDILDQNTQQTETYSGLYNTIHMGATLLRTSVLEAQMKQMARLYQWESAKFNEEKTKRFEKTPQRTEVFVSFYTPEKKHDDLHKNQTLWKIFLDVGGKRYDGTATKIKLLTTEVQGLYPFHNRFSTPYIVSFPVSTQTVDGQEAKLTITGSVGSTTAIFAIKK